MPEKCALGEGGGGDTIGGGVGEPRTGIIYASMFACRYVLVCGPTSVDYSAWVQAACLPTCLALNIYTHNTFMHFCTRTSCISLLACLPACLIKSYLGYVRIMTEVLSLSLVGQLLQILRRSDADVICLQAGRTYQEAGFVPHVSDEEDPNRGTRENWTPFKRQLICKKS